MIAPDPSTPSGNGYLATLQVTEVEQVYPVRFEELHVSECDPATALRAKDPLFSKGTLPATHPVFERYAKWVEEYLASKGIQEKISGTVVPTGPASLPSSLARRVRCRPWRTFRSRVTWSCRRRRSRTPLTPPP